VADATTLTNVPPCGSGGGGGGGGGGCHYGVLNADVEVV
jgi:hypothetical protein